MSKLFDKLFYVFGLASVFCYVNAGPFSANKEEATVVVEENDEYIDFVEYEDTLVVDDEVDEYVDLVEYEDTLVVDDEVDEYVDLVEYEDTLVVDDEVDEYVDLVEYEDTLVVDDEVNEYVDLVEYEDTLVVDDEVNEYVDLVEYEDTLVVDDEVNEYIDFVEYEDTLVVEDIVDDGIVVEDAFFGLTDEDFSEYIASEEADENKKAVVVTDEDIDFCVDKLMEVFSEDLDWSSVYQVVTMASKILDDFFDLSDQDKRAAMIAVAYRVIDVTDTPWLPDTLCDPVLKALVSTLLDEGFLLPESQTDLSEDK